MKAHIYLFLFSLLIGTSCQQAQKTEQRIFSADIDRFWQAYDQIQLESDSAKQLQILQELFIEPASFGQQQLFAVRNYTPEEYITNLRSYPKFYQSLKKNHERRTEVISAIESGLANFQKFYPNIKNGKIYLGVGNFRTNGTTVDTTVLFGTEMIFGDENLEVSEMPERMQYFKNYIQDKPIEDIDFLAAHEFVHTQQVEAIGAGLLATVLRGRQRGIYCRTNFWESFAQSFR